MTLSNEQLADLKKPMQNLKIICGAMIMGVFTAGVIFCTMIDLGNLKTDLEMLVAMAAGFGMVMYMMSFVMFKVLSTQTNSSTGSATGHFGVLQSAWIVRFAIIEGACFLNLIVTLLQNSLITLFVALLGVLLMLIWFPRSMKVEELLEERMRG